MAAGTLVGALLLCAPATAQQAAGDISERIERTFALVIGNSAELAIPLTRRALARRFSESDQTPEVPPLAYSAPEAAMPDLPPEDPLPADQSAAASPNSEVIEQGSADDPVEDADTARLPRPRPVLESDASGDAAADDPADAPLDLVAGAADPADEQLATEDLQPLVTSSLQAPSAVAPAPPPPVPVAALPPAPKPELVSSGSCLSPGDVTDKDGDFKRNATVLAEPGFCIEEESFKERRRSWNIETVKTGRPGPLFAVMHDDEDMSFDNAIAALKSYGGTLVAVETGGKRNQDGIDPNRNFSADGIGCKKLGDDATPHYTGFFKGLLDPGQPIIALHNNTGKRIPTGGVGHVSLGDAPKEMEVHKSDNPDGPLAGNRTLVLLTSPIPVSTTSKAVAEELNAKGINALIERVSADKGDCSLSNYTLLTGHTDYLNVTVDSDEADKQKKIIDLIMAGRNDKVATQ